MVTRGLACVLLLLLLFPVCGASRSFTDDLGRKFEFTGKPTMVVRAGLGGTSLFHYGLDTDQIIGIYGNWGVRGSRVVNDGFSSFTDYDPTTEEVAKFESIVNLSPSCYNVETGCWDIDIDILLRLSPDYFVYIDSGIEAKKLVGVENPTDIDYIFIDTFYEGGCRDPDTLDEGPNCKTRSSIDIAERIAELAVAISGNDLPQSVQDDKETMCRAAVDFTKTMEDVQDDGIRVMAPVVGFGSEFLIRTNDPTRFWNLRTFEELGMPLLHSNGDEYTTSDWFSACTGNVTSACSSETKLPVDFWLIDSRSYNKVTDSDFIESFPDPALKQQQFMYWARNDGAISYRSVARVLNRMSSAMKTTKRIHPRTPCTQVDTTSTQFLLTESVAGGGLTEGQYACYHADKLQKKYFDCENLSLPSLVSSAFSFATGLAAVVALLAAVF